MKQIWKFGIVLCLFLFMTSAASASENRTLPSEDQIKSLCESIDKGDSYVSDLFESAKEKGYVCDLWKCEPCQGEKLAISLYYPADNKNGYKSIYTSEKGEYRNSIPNLELKESYKGETDTEENVTEKENDTEEHQEVETSEEEVKESDEKSSDEEFTVENTGDKSEEEKLDEFMEYFETKDSVSLEEIRAHAKDVFFGDDE